MDFTHVKSATATYQLDVADDAQRVLLDCRGLDIQTVTVDGQKVELSSDQNAFIGQPRHSHRHIEAVAVAYSTTDQADAFLWVEGDAFLFTEPSHGRNMGVPNSPGIRHVRRDRSGTKVDGG